MTDIENTQQAETEEPQEIEPQEPETAPEPVEEEPDTFPREYVEKLRKEAAGHRDRAKQADDLREALWAARVAATGRLADPSDLPLPDDGDPLDIEAVNAAVDALVTTKPHLAARTVAGTVGQGHSELTTHTDLAGILRARA